MGISQRGAFKKECNVTTCTVKGDRVIFFNQSTQKYYCDICAKRINEDPYNAKESMKLFGTKDVCIKRPFGDKQKYIMLQDDSPERNIYLIKEEYKELFIDWNKRRGYENEAHTFSGNNVSRIGLNNLGIYEHDFGV